MQDEQDYPPGQLPREDIADKYFWINGRIELRELIGIRQRSIDSEIQSLQDKLNRLSVKEVNGNKYWYLWDRVDGKWYSKGSIGDGDYEDYLKSEIQRKEEEKEEIEQKIRDTVVGQVRDHVIVNTRKWLIGSNEAIPLKEIVYPFEKGPGKKLPDNLL